MDEDPDQAVGVPPEAARPDDSPLLHPANEGHDEERQRDHLEKWAAQERDDGPDARALREAQERALAAGAPVEEVLPLEPPIPPPPHGSTPGAEDWQNRREDRAPPYGKRSRND
jgi:hypothetical protein